MYSLQAGGNDLDAFVSCDLKLLVLAPRPRSHLYLAAFGDALSEVTGHAFSFVQPCEQARGFTGLGGHDDLSKFHSIVRSYHRNDGLIAMDDQSIRRNFDIERRFRL